MARTKEDLERLNGLKDQIPKIAVPPMSGSLVHYNKFLSKFIRSRPFDVWFPENYAIETNRRYPVIYMHDGQMMFHHENSSLAGLDVFWDVDKVISRLIDDDEIVSPMVVSIWMSDWTKAARKAEYMPQKAVTQKAWEKMCGIDTSWISNTDSAVLLSSDNYLQYIVTELKPFIDDTYPTLTGRDDTFMVGSSMGGLISAYALSEYPEVFGGVACLSTDWSMGDGIVTEWFADHWPAPGTNRIYFDHGTETLDADYAPYQIRMDQLLRNRGYTEGSDWISLRFEGADHSPKSWKNRLKIPLTFLLGNNRSNCKL